MTTFARRTFAVITSAALAVAAALVAAPTANAASATTGAVTVGNVTGGGDVPIAEVVNAPAAADPVATFVVSYTCTALNPEDKQSTCTNMVVTVPDIAQFPEGSVNTPTSLAVELVQNTGAGWVLTRSNDNGNVTLTVTNPGPISVGVSSTFTLRVTPSVMTPNGTKLVLQPTIDADGWDAAVKAPNPASVTVKGTPEGETRLFQGVKTLDGSTVTVPYTATVTYVTATGLPGPAARVGSEAVHPPAGVQVVFQIPAGATLANADAYENATYDPVARTLTFALEGDDFDYSIHGAIWSPPTEILLQVPRRTVPDDPRYTMTAVATATSISGAHITSPASSPFDGRFVEPSLLFTSKIGRGVIEGDYNTRGTQPTYDTLIPPQEDGSPVDPWANGSYALSPGWADNVATGYRFHLTDRFPTHAGAAPDTGSTRTTSGTAGTGTVYSSPSEAVTDAPAFILTGFSGSNLATGTATLLLDDGSSYGPIALDQARYDFLKNAATAKYVGHIVGLEADLTVVSTASSGTATIYLYGTPSADSVRPGDDRARLQNTATVTWSSPDGVPALTASSTGNILVQDITHPVTGYASVGYVKYKPSATSTLLSPSWYDTLTPNKKSMTEIAFSHSHWLDYGDTTMLTALVVPDSAGLVPTSSTAQTRMGQTTGSAPVTVTALSGAGEGSTAYTSPMSPAGATLTSAATGGIIVYNTFSLSEAEIGIHSYQVWTVQPDNTVPVTACGQYGGELTADVYDLDGDGNVAEMACKVTAKITIIGDTQAGFQVSKSAQDASGEWIAGPGIADIGTAATYTQKLRFLNFGAQPLSNPVMYDVLPFVGDTTVVYDSGSGPAARHSAFQPVFAGVVSVSSPDVTVYYSTSATPCMPEVNSSNPGVPQAGCDPAWSATAPADLSTVRALKIVKPGAGSLPIAESFEVEIAQTMPETDGSLYGQVAFNSVAGGASLVTTPLQPTESDPSGVVSRPVNLPLLPMTGGTGSWIFLASGGAALLAAAAVWMRRRSANAATASEESMH